MRRDATRPTDLASIFGPITIDVSPFGPVRLPIRTAGFLRWFEAGRKAKRWADGEVFVRAMLAEQARTPGVGDETPLPAELVAELPLPVIELIAAAILDATGPTLIRSPADERQSDGAGPDKAVIEENSVELAAPERLVAMIGAYADHHRNAMKRVAEQFRKADSLSTIGRAMSATSAFQLEVARLQGLADRVGPSDSIGRFLAERPKIGLIEGLASSAFVDQQKHFAGQIAAITASMRAMAPTLAYADRFKPMISTRLHDQILASQFDWIKTVNAGFDLRLSSRLLSDLASVQSASAEAARAVSAIIAETHFDRLGFQTTANLALGGLVAQGAAADVLQRYGQEPALHGAAFDAVLEAIRVLDEDEPAGSPGAAAERAWHVIALRLSAKLPHLDGEGFYRLATLMLAALGVIVAAAAYVEQARSNSSPTLERIETEVGAMHREYLANRAADAEADRFLRYVHSIVNLRAEPSRGGLVLRLVYPDQLVRVLETKGDWARVEVFDYGSETRLQGWINRRYLRIKPAS